MVVEFLHDVVVVGVGVDPEGPANSFGLIAGEIDCLFGSFGDVRRNSGWRGGVMARARWRL